MQRDIETTRKEAYGALTFGLLQENDFKDYESDLDYMLSSLQETVKFTQKHDHLKSMCLALNEKREVKIGAARRRLQTEKIGPEHPAYSKISHVLETGDALTANEYIETVLKGLPLPQDEYKSMRSRSSSHTSSGR